MKLEQVSTVDLTEIGALELTFTIRHGGKT